MGAVSRTWVLAVSAFVLAGTQMIEGVKFLGDAPYLSVLLFLAAILGVLAGAKLCRDNCFESRFTLAMIALSTVAGHLLTITAGVPGSAIEAWSGANAVLGFTSVTAALLILAMLVPRFFSSYTPANSRPPV